MVNVLLTSFAGLGLPRTLSLPVRSDSTIQDVVLAVLDRLPPQVDRQVIITTTSNKQLQRTDTSTISSLLPEPTCTFLPLRLSVRLCGGKGGFGSQLRAAGGRMSSRKKRDQNQNPNGSNRNLDGRRLRVIDSAKDLARYLATKPEMEAKEKEEKRKRWEAVVESAEKKEEEIRSGKGGGDRGRLNAEFVESKDLAEEKTREAVLRAMREGRAGNERTGSESSMEEDDSDDDDLDAGQGSSGSSDDAAGPAQAKSNPVFFGWDEEDDASEDDEDEEDGRNVIEQEPKYEGKGKARMTT